MQMTFCGCGRYSYSDIHETRTTPSEDIGKGDIKWPLLRENMLTQHPTGLRWDQLYTRLARSTRVAANRRRGDIKGSIGGRWSMTGIVQESGLKNAKLLISTYHGTFAPCAEVLSDVRDHPIRDQPTKYVFLSSCRARSRLGRSSKRLVVDQLSRCTRKGEKQKARCLPKSKQNKLQTQTQPKQPQQRKTARKLSETLRFQKIQSS